MATDGDLRAVLRHKVPENWAVDTILAALAAADEPLTATVECHACIPGDLRDVCRTCNRTGTTRIVAMTEDVLRAGIKAGLNFEPTACDYYADAIVRALFGEAT